MNAFHKHEVDSLKTELNVCQRKLESKAEALLILTRDLGQCRQERDQFKLMAEQVQHRYQALKRQLSGVGPRPSVSEMDTETCGMKQHNLQSLIYDLQETNKSLQFEVDDLKQKHKDAQGDIKLLREQIARQRVGTTDEGMTTRHFPAHEREDLVKQLEAAREQVEQMERDLQQVFDDKEEQETERDIYKHKYERLNQELNYILKGDENRILDIDALSMENKYLHDRLKQMEEEKTMAMATVTKYKSILERKKNKGILKLGQSRSGGVVISQKQVQQLLEEGGSPTPQLLADLQSLSSALLESVNDKNLALSHQRKTNKILGQRVAELEKKLKTLEVSGLWNMSGGVSPGGSMEGSLDKLRLECDEIKSLHASSSADHDDDLDLLPTKEEAGDHIPYHSSHLSSVSSELPADDKPLDLHDPPRDPRDLIDPHDPPHDLHDPPRDLSVLCSMDPAINDLKQDMLGRRMDNGGGRKGGAGVAEEEGKGGSCVVGAGGDIPLGAAEKRELEKGESEKRESEKVASEKRESEKGASEKGGSEKGASSERESEKGVSLERESEKVALEKGASEKGGSEKDALEKKSDVDIQALSTDFKPSSSETQSLSSEIPSSSNAIQPSGHDGQSSSSDTQSSSTDFQPSSDTQPSRQGIQPLSHDIQSSSHDIQPSSHNIQPSSGDFQPSIHDIQPSANEPQPSTNDLQDLLDVKLPSIQLNHDQVEQSDVLAIPQPDDEGNPQDQNDDEHKVDEVFRADLDDKDDENDDGNDGENDDDSDEDEETALKKVDLTDLTPSLEFQDEDEEGDVDKLEELVHNAAANLVRRQSSSSNYSDDEEEGEEDEQCLIHNDEPTEVTA